MVDDEIAALLFKIVKVIQKKAKSLPPADPIDDVYTSHNFSKYRSNFLYEELFLDIIDKSRKTIKPQTSLGGLIDYLNSEFIKSDIFNQAVDVLAKQYSLDNNTALTHIEKFTSAIALMLFKKDIEDSDIAAIVTKVIGEIEGRPIIYNIDVALSGISIPENEKCIFADDISLSRKEIQPTSIWLISNQFPYNMDAVTVLNFSVKTNNTKDKEDMLTILVEILRLFRLGSIKVLSFEEKPDSFFGGGSGYYEEQRIAETYEYQLTNQDNTKLTELYTKLTPCLKQVLDTHSSSSYNYIRIGLLRFEDALIRDIPIEGRITSAITSLEALLLNPKERDELSRRLGQRLGKLLSYFGYSAFDVYENTMSAYSIRSDYIHGGEVDSKELEKAPELCEKIMNYVRICLQIYLQISNTHKNHIVSMLDRSLLENTDIEKLNDLLSDVKVTIG